MPPPNVCHFGTDRVGSWEYHLTWRGHGKSVDRRESSVCLDRRSRQSLSPSCEGRGGTRCRARDIFAFAFCFAFALHSHLPQPHCGAESPLAAVRLSFLVHCTDCLGARAEAKEASAMARLGRMAVVKRGPSRRQLCASLAPQARPQIRHVLRMSLVGVGEHYAIGASLWSHRASPWLLWPSVSCSLCGLILSDAVREQSLKQPCAHRGA